MSFGHGWVHPRPDGAKARCGGPGLCGDCAREAAGKAPVPQPEPRGRRIKRLVFSDEFLLPLFRIGEWPRVRCVESTLPADAEVVRATRDDANGLIHLYVASEEFDLVPEGGFIPAMRDPVFRRDG
jgi:hypothetical protein